MYINIYEGIMGNEHYIGYIEYEKDLPLPRKDDFIEIMINEKPCLCEINAVLFDYTDKENEFNEFICFLVHRTKYF